MKKIFLFLLTFYNLSFSQTYSGSGGIITDNQQVVEFSINVNGLPQNSLNSTFGVTQVCLNISHTWNSDLNVWLVSPDGTLSNLFSGIGGDSDNFTNTCFSQSATTSIVSGVAPYTGTYKPQETIGNVNNNQNGNGIWKLRILDTYPQDEGNLISWNITFGPNAPTPFVFTSSNLPIVIINTTEQIVDEPSIIGTMKIIDNGVGNMNTISDVPNNYNGKISIEIRGNYSQILPQKPYKIETLNDAEEELNVSLLGMPEENDWALLANYNDKVFMRNQLAYNLFAEMGHYGCRTKHCEVVINGVYQGVYLLSETIKRDNDRVDIAKLNPDENSGIDLTGGYIIKNDYWDTTTGWQLSHSPIDYPGLQVGLAYHYPKYDVITIQQKAYIASFINDFENALYSQNYTNPDSGYNKYIDVESFIDYFIINELSRNNDGFRKSSYFHKDKNSQTSLSKLKAGPVWDFDWAWKNINECPSLSVTDGSGWAYLINDCNPDVNSLGWYVRLLQDVNFQNQLKCRWVELRNSILSFQNLFSYIDNTANYLNDAQERHFEKWCNLGISTGTPELDNDPNTFAGQILKFKNWITTRINWLDSNLPGSATNCNLGNNTFDTNSVSIFPNPAKEIVTINLTNDNILSIELIDFTGKKVLIQEMNIETKTNTLDISSLANGIYFIKIKSDKNAVLSKKIMVMH